MMKIGSDRARKFQPVCFREDRENCARTRALQMFDHLGIARNRIGTLIRPNDEEEKRTRAKISTDALSGGLDN